MNRASTSAISSFFSLSLILSFFSVPSLFHLPPWILITTLFLQTSSLLTHQHLHGWRQLSHPGSSWPFCIRAFYSLRLSREIIIHCWPVNNRLTLGWCAPLVPLLQLQGWIPNTGVTNMGGKQVLKREHQLCRVQAEVGCFFCRYSSCYLYSCDFFSIEGCPSCSA